MATPATTILTLPAICLLSVAGSMIHVLKTIIRIIMTTSSLLYSAYGFLYGCNRRIVTTTPRHRRVAKCHIEHDAEGDTVQNIVGNSKGRVHSCKVPALPPSICSVMIIPLET